MSDNKKNEDKSDLTRIEDLSEYLHDEDESMDGLESFDGVDDFDLMDAKTDPNIELPPEFTQNFSTSSIEEETDFEAMENDLPDIPDEDYQEDESPEFSSDFEDSSFDSDFDQPTDDTSFDNNQQDLDESSFDGPDFDHQDFPTSNDEFLNDEDDFSSNEDDFSTQQDNFPDDKLNLNTDVDEFSETHDELKDDSFEQELIEDSPTSDLDLGTDFPVSQQEAKESEEDIVDVISNLSAETSTELPARTFLKEEPISDSPAQEDLEDIKQFAKSISYGNLATEGNPPFSIVIKDVKYQEDIEDIVQLLKEFQIIKDEQDEKRTIESLNRSNLLIPRLGEYSAILVCHKLRRFDINILMGLTEEINPPKEYESEDRGIVSKYSVYNSRSHHYDLKKDETSPEDILASTTPYLEGHDILEYLGIVSESAVIDNDTLTSSSQLEDQLIARLPDYQQDRQRVVQVERENLLASTSTPPEDFLQQETVIHKTKNKVISINDIQSELVGKLKHQAVQLKGNAIVGVSLHVTPIGAAQGPSGREQYQLTCSGSVVWINKR